MLEREDMGAAQLAGCCYYHIGNAYQEPQKKEPLKKQQSRSPLQRQTPVLTRAFVTPAHSAAKASFVACSRGPFRLDLPGPCRSAAFCFR